MITISFLTIVLISYKVENQMYKYDKGKMRRYFKNLLCYKML